MQKLTLIACALVALTLAGCSGGEDAKETKDLRESMTGNKPFDINNVPEKDRAMVQAIRNGGGRPGANPSAGGGTPTPPAKPGG